MLLTLTAICFAVALLSLSVVLRIKRIRDQRELEQHSITAEELHSLLASNKEILLFDVRQPLDLLAYPEIIHGARRIPPKEVLERPSLIPKDKQVVVYCTCPGEKTSRAILHRALAMHFSRSSSSKVDWRPGKQRAIRSSHTERSFTSTLLP